MIGLEESEISDKIQTLRKSRHVLGNCFELLLFLFVFFFRALLRSIKPFNSVVHSSLQLRLVSRIKFVCQFFITEGVAEVVGIRFETILSSDARSCSLILS